MTSSALLSFAIILVTVSASSFVEPPTVADVDRTMQNLNTANDAMHISRKLWLADWASLGIRNRECKIQDSSAYAELMELDGKTEIMRVAQFCAPLNNYQGIRHCSAVIDIGQPADRVSYQIHIISDFKPIPDTMFVKFRKVGNDPLVKTRENCGLVSSKRFTLGSSTEYYELDSNDFGCMPYVITHPGWIERSSEVVLGTIADLMAVVHKYTTVTTDTADTTVTTDSGGLGSEYQLFVDDCQTFSTRLVNYIASPARGFANWDNGPVSRANTPTEEYFTIMHEFFYFGIREGETSVDQVVGFLVREPPSKLEEESDAGAMDLSRKIKQLEEELRVLEEM